MARNDNLRAEVFARRLAASGRGRTIRHSAGLTCAEVGDQVGVNGATISRWETGKRTPRGEDAGRYGRVLASLERAISCADGALEAS